MKRAEDEQMEEEATNAGLTVEEYQLTVQKQQEEFEAKRKAKIAGANADLGESPSQLVSLSILSITCPPHQLTVSSLSLLSPRP
jgi:hypothetical protein